jgi:hypothetical protein
MIDILDPSRLRQRTPHLQCWQARSKITADRKNGDVYAQAWRRPPDSAAGRATAAMVHAAENRPRCLSGPSRF